MKIIKTTHLILVIVFILFLQGCESLGPTLPEKRVIAPIGSNAVKTNTPVVTIPPLDTSAGLVDKPSAEVYKGNGVFSRPIKSVNANKHTEEVGSFMLNFNDVELIEVVKVILGDTLKYTFSISSKVVGKVSLHTAEALTKAELLPTLEALLSMHNAVLIQKGPLYRVELSAAVLSAGNIPFRQQDNQRNGVQIQVIPLKFIGVDDMRKVLEPILPKQSILRADTHRNLLFITGNSAELDNALDLVKLFDIDIMQGKSVGLFPLKYIEPRTAQKELAEIFGNKGDGPLSGILNMMPIERLNALMVISTQPKYLSRVEQWIKRLDRTGAEGHAERVHVYEVQNVDAAKLAAILEQVYQSNQTSRQTSTVKKSLAPGLTPSTISSKGVAKKQPTAQAITKRPPDLGISNQVNGPMRIIPDEANNALVIVASAQDYESIKKVIKKLDVTPLQVLVDATIIEVSLTDELHYGLQWFFTNKSSLGSGRVGDANTSGAGVGGFSYSLVNSAAAVRAELNALANDSRVNVLSAPSLMVLNNQEATIKVGDQVPIRTSESANTNATVGDTALITSTIQLRDTGVTLTVKPRVNAGGLVIMEIEQNVDGVSRTESSEIDSPTIQQRQIKSSVAVQSGETIVLGGLITEQRELGQSGVPVLSRLPIIGGLFGKTDKVLDRTELVVLITPRIVKNEQDSRLITHEFKKRLKGIYQSN